ncbi:MAG TPA: DUF983 domain-containing protein [Acidimicrobiia bacterium]|nr:DUF983 domain-containing protein [Acidimicrobiia bacterium]
MTRPARARILWRGATRRCARCGHGHLFHRWFTMVPDCPTCGLHFEREEGYWVGALAVNLVLVGGLFAVAFVAVIVATAPDIPVAPLLALLVPVMVIGPIVAFPFSRTLWVAIDRAFLQPL